MHVNFLNSDLEIFYTTTTFIFETKKKIFCYESKELVEP
jgi:hypothetical protein